MVNDNELPEELDIGEIRLEPGETFYYTAWGIRYRFKGEDWKIAQMSFRKKSDAMNWMNDKIITYEGIEGEVVPVKRCLLLDDYGNVKTWTEELT